MQLTIFSGGAAQAVVTGLQARFERRHACAINGTFGAVGAMRDKLLAGEPCDVLVLSQALIEALERQGHVVAGSGRPLGAVPTAVAVPAGAPHPALGNSAALKIALLACSALYVPDLTRSTAGQHIARMLADLSLTEALAARVREFPNGATAMREMARAADPASLGCTQLTEILFTKGVEAVAELPADHALSTVYQAAQCTAAKQPALAGELIELLAGDVSIELRQGCGFVI